ncbi:MULTISPECIES: FHA domain-containing protein FhaB/FipA [Cellulomonas]|uniref:FHA domain-containing protein n=1 Tax=Cellulomonas uda TaxID=1714 RepID=A0A4Y3KEA9_CELUD|nr:MULTISPECIES: FHA domain-containing protein [Cellulomonas]ASR55968.1 hypothetical protein CBP52_13645 [Cellulomonas sp. PSBB021]NII66402.1 hypothetical protein [Cellulomonas uda]GEA82302.1 FHA domain-containing protein [Cellulomonas uda]
MSELTITLLRLGYLALLWVLVLSSIAVLRRDLYGTRITKRRSRTGAPAPVPAAAGPAVATTGPPTAPTPVTAPRSARGQRAQRGAQRGARLVVTQGPLTGTILPLTQSAVVVGRAPGCTLVLEDDYSSSRHARIFPQGGAWYVEDMGSTNGTFVHDQSGDHKISGPTPLTPGQSVRVGRSVIELQG